MHRFAGLLLATLAILASVPAIAGERTVNLQLENFSCPSCAFIVKRTLMEIPGVAACEVSYRERLARITFDDEKTSVAALTAATSELGFPSSPVN